MSIMYRVNDIFHSLQGEGHHTGRAAVFVRLAGCNLSCPFCDTDFSRYRVMSATDIADAVAAFAPTRFVVLTGGEPTLQADDTLIEQLHRRGCEVAMESNGTRQPPREIDWLTVSPKQGTTVGTCDELKVVVGDSDADYAAAEQWAASIVSRYHYLHPCDTGHADRNRAIIDRCILYIKSHPRWRLSLQTHKLAGFK